MSRALEHGSIELQNSCLELKQTELTLGLPGSHSPDRKPSLISVSLFGKQLQNNVHSLGSLKNTVSGAKRLFSDTINWTFSAYNEADVHGGFQKNSSSSTLHACASATVKEEIVEERKSQLSASTAQVVGWPPIRSFRKNTMASSLAKSNDDAENHPSGCIYVKVSMEGAPYLRKIDLKTYRNYMELSSALENMFSSFSYGKNGLCKNRLNDVLDGSENVLTYEDKDGDWMLVGDVPWEMFTGSCRRLKIINGSEATGLAPRTTEKFRNRN